MEVRCRVRVIDNEWPFEIKGENRPGMVQRKGDMRRKRQRKRRKEKEKKKKGQNGRM